MTTFQIIALSVIGAVFLAAVVFFILFLVEINRKEKVEEPIVEDNAEEEQEVEEVTEIDIDNMLAMLEASSKAKESKVVEEEKKDEVVEETVEELPEVEVVVDEEQVISEEVVEELKPAEEVEETKVEEPAEEKVNEEKVEEPKTTVIIKKIVKEGPEFDYRVRLEKIKDSEEKLEKDLEKTEKAITKYERTERRLARNQKLLDRKAGELANLNLLMYNITDIKNIDEEKKTRQEELVAHISELKASIEDAQKYLTANAEKHANNIKLRDYLKSEQVRYKEEWAELEILIAQAEGREPITTVETKVETTKEPVDADDDADVE